MRHRHDDDTWDLATSVGATATLVAAARAVASRTDRRLVDDAFAEPLVRAVGIDVFERWAGGELDLSDDDCRHVLQWFVDLMAVRTRYFDEFFLDAAAAGIRQAVILAAGLDARSYRLPWPPGTTVFEIDQPPVSAFKTATLAGMDAQPTADLRAVPVDLRLDWPAALRGAGFESGRPTAWIAEGLLPFLPPDAQDRLLDQVSALSSAGSRLAAEVFVPPSREVMRPLRERWSDQGFDVEPSDLVYAGPRHDVARYLAQHGWETVTTPLTRLLADNGIATRAAASPFAGSKYYASIRT
ncbi:class I SAM-dependent methyltransferase [Mycobacterium helveticum]|uniref:S-adenosyl-L-methionine-dependent methyltransferase n=2 Tax=Mycobacterium helveticum TaxID=2592811 RepID=A0A557WWS1_9MYCO|nr:class I SAM-dependent methyltransferase [Mycobacterium helveticum]TVS77701.1 class I SAM-dependent methyltransferase [Mycobacterium helveticum]